MHSIESGNAALDEALKTLEIVESHVEFLDVTGQGKMARGAENTWLNDAIRAAMMPAATQAQAEAKIRLLGGPVDEWAILATRDNGLAGAASLIRGALTVEAQTWDLPLPMSLEACGIRHVIRTWPITIAPDVMETYCRNAGRRHAGQALRRFTALASEIEGLFARGEDAALISDAIQRSREALLDVMTVTIRDVADLKSIP